jgi:AraC-like DNA-binding protein
VPTRNSARNRQITGRAHSAKNNALNLDLNASEIAYAVVFQSPTQFSRLLGARSDGKRVGALSINVNGRTGVSAGAGFRIGTMKTPYMRKLGKRSSRNTEEVRIGTDRDFSRRSGVGPLFDFSRPNENAERQTDVELMEAVVRRDSDAMTAIYQRYESTLRAVILSVLREEADTDDFLHDVFIQLWNRADRFVAEKELRGFLITLARRRALDRLRRRLAYHRAIDRFETLMRTEFRVGGHRIRLPVQLRAMICECSLSGSGPCFREPRC